MKKNRVFKFFLFAVIGLFVTVTSCKDYDDDIKNQNTKITALEGMKSDLKKAIEDVSSKVETAQKAADAAKAAADAAAKAAAEGKVAAEVAAAAKAAAAKAQATADAAAAAAAKAAAEGKSALEVAAAAKTAAEKAQTTANEAKKKGDELQKGLDNLAKRVKALEDKKVPSVEEVAALGKDIETLKAQVEAFIGKRLSSLALVPTHHINGIAAITLKSMEYKVQSFNPLHKKYQYTTTGRTIRTIDSKNTIVDFRLSPRYITKEDVGFPYFESWVSENNITRAVTAANTGKNKPIAPVEGQVLDITKEGVLKLKVTKTVDGPVGHETNAGKTNEKFYMASLAIPIAERHWTSAEKESGEIPTITSEAYRIAEVTTVPRIKSTLAVKELAQSWDPATMQKDQAPKHYRPYSLDRDGKPMHYSDSAMLYSSNVKELIDINVDWEKGHDLKELVTVCTEDGHATLENYADYGLEFRFAVAKGKYLQGNNQTDQQQFAEIKDAKEGLLTSRVYTIGGSTQTALGREPIIRVSLINTKNKNELVDQRYIKVKWAKIVEPQTLKPHTFDPIPVSCDNVVWKFGTQEMNEKIYRQIEKSWGISKEQFHHNYTSMAIEKLLKGNEEIIKEGIAVYPGLTFGTTATPDRDVEFYTIPDANDNTSYNLVWEMSPKAVGTIVPKAKETYTISITFKAAANSGYSDIHMDFLADVTIPTQEFTYQGTYWKNGVGQGVFNVNPIVYEPNSQNPDYDGYPVVSEFSHIEADLVNGYIYAPTEQKPANLAQFIRHIRSCAKVKFVFDENRFNSYPHLSGYTVSTDGISLWKGTATTPATFDYIQDDKLAATINNKFGATVESNKKFLPWDLNETLDSGVDEATSVIRLHEKDEKDGTTAAKALVGKNIPVNLVVEYNEYNKAAVQKFEVHFINPLTVNGTIKDPFTDAVVNGSFTSVEKGFGFTDWNNYIVAKKKPGEAQLQKYAEQLYQYYAVKAVVFDTEKTTSSLKLQGDTYIHVDGYKEGKLPTNRSVKQVVMTNENATPPQYSIVNENPTHLGYFNNNGTPVNMNYNMYVNVTVGYKWGTMSKNGIEIKVNKAQGTPSNP